MSAVLGGGRINDEKHPKGERWGSRPQVPPSQWHSGPMGGGGSSSSGGCLIALTAWLAYAASTALFVATVWWLIV